MTSEPPTGPVERLAADALARIGTTLADRVEKLSGRVDENSAKVDENTHRVRVKIRWLVGLIIADLLLSGMVFYSYLTVRKVVEDALCPLFSIFVGSYDPNSRAPGPGREQYEENFRKIRIIYYDALECSEHPAGPNRYLPQPSAPPSN